MLFRSAVSLVQKLDNIALVKTIMALQQQCYDLVFENRDLREKLIKAEQALTTQNQLQFRRNAYWFDDTGSEQSGPLCSACWDSKRLVVRMVRMASGIAHCNNCDKAVRYADDNRPEPPMRGVSNWVQDY